MPENLFKRLLMLDNILNRYTMPRLDRMILFHYLYRFRLLLSHFGQADNLLLAGTDFLTRQGIMGRQRLIIYADALLTELISLGSLIA